MNTRGNENEMRIQASDSMPFMLITLDPPSIEFQAPAKLQFAMAKQGKSTAGVEEDIKAFAKANDLPDDIFKTSHNKGGQLILSVDDPVAAVRIVLAILKAPDSQCSADQLNAFYEFAQKNAVLKEDKEALQQIIKTQIQHEIEKNSILVNTYNRLGKHVEHSQPGLVEPLDNISENNITTLATLRERNNAVIAAIKQDENQLINSNNNVRKEMRSMEDDMRTMNSKLPPDQNLSTPSVSSNDWTQLDRKPYIENWRTLCDRVNKSVNTYEKNVSLKDKLVTLFQEFITKFGNAMAAVANAISQKTETQNESRENSPSKGMRG